MPTPPPWVPPPVTPVARNNQYLQLQMHITNRRNSVPFWTPQIPSSVMLSVSVENHTESLNVTPLAHRTTYLTPSPSTSRKVSGPKMNATSAPSGSMLKDVPTPSTALNTYAPAVVPLTMEPSLALEHRKLSPQTPYIAEA